MPETEWRESRLIKPCQQAIMRLQRAAFGSRVITIPRQGDVAANGARVAAPECHVGPQSGTLQFLGHDRHGRLCRDAVEGDDRTKPGESGRTFSIAQAGYDGDEIRIVRLAFEQSVPAWCSDALVVDDVDIGTGVVLVLVTTNVYVTFCGAWPDSIEPALSIVRAGAVRRTEMFFVMKSGVRSVSNR